MTTDLPEITSETPMSDVLKHYPGAQRALFSRYHIGGCQSCGFAPTETLGAVCKRNEDLPVTEVVEHIQQSHESDQKILAEPVDLHSALAGDNPPKVLDIRTREEHEAVMIPGSLLFSQDLVQEAFGTWPKDTEIYVYDHQGDRSLDAAAYFIGHGFANTKALRGGIDAYSVEADSSLPRYRIEH